MDEEFLGFILGRMTADVRVAQGGDISQVEIDKKVKEGEAEVSTVTFLEQDPFQVADLIREWARDPSRAFPVDFDFGPPTAPVTRTVFKMTYFPVIDRHWHNEWPVRIDLRAVNRIEAIEMEIRYWSGVGDHRRAELLQERLAELRPAGEGGTGDGVSP